MISSEVKESISYNADFLCYNDSRREKVIPVCCIECRLAHQCNFHIQNSIFPSPTVLIHLSSAVLLKKHENAQMLAYSDITETPR